MNGTDSASGGKIIYDLTANLRPFEEGLSQAEKTAKKTGSAIEEGFSSGASGAAKSVQKLSSTVLSNLKDISKGLASISWDAITTGSATALTSLLATSKKAIKDTQFLENANIQMQSFTGSVEMGSKAMAEAYKFFKNNPFDRFTTTDAVKSMIQFGASMDDIGDNLSMLGNISLSTGANLAELAYTYQRSIADNKLGLMDLEVLANRGVPIYKGFQEALGMTSSKVRELTGSGQLTGDMLKKVFQYLASTAGPAMAQFEQTLSRQQDRLSGGFSNLRGLLAGYKVTANGLEMDNYGLYRSFVALETEFVNIFRGTKITAEQYEQLSPLMKQFVDNAGGVEAYNARNAAVAEKLNSAMSELGVVLAEILVKLADKLPGLIDGVATVFKFLADHSSALIPVATMALVAFGKIGSTLPGVGGLIGSLAAGTNLLTKGLTDLGKALGSALLTKLGAFSKSAKVAAQATGTLSSAGKISSIAGKAVTSGLIPAIKGLASILPLALKASAVIAVIGAAIGAFIGAIGAGIWLFGEGLAAIGRGFSSLATGIGELNKVEADNIPAVIKKLAKALSGLFWQLGDFAVAAATFKSIGQGLQEIAKALEMLRGTKESDLKILKPLAQGLKEFQIGLFDNIFSGNIISKFKDLGNSIQYIAELISVISNIKIEDEKLKDTMSSLAEGLKAFMIAELRPGFLGKLWVDIDYKSVTDYMSSLGNIIEPLNKLYELMNKKKFDGQAMTELLKNLAEAFGAFRSEEVRLGTIPNFLYGNIDYVSVIKYVEGLGQMIQPLSDLFDLMSKSKFDGDQFTHFLSNLGKSFESFKSAELRPSEINKFFIGDIEYTSVIKYVENLENIIEPLNDLYSLMSRNNFDPDKFAKFVSDLGQALHSFTTKEGPSGSIGLFNAHFENLETKGILEFFTNFGQVVQDLSSLNDLLQKDKFDSDKFVGFIRGIGEALQSFMTPTLEQSLEAFPFYAKLSNKTFGSVLTYVDQFKTLASVVSDLSETLSREKAVEPDVIVNFVKGMVEALNATIFEANTDTLEGGVSIFGASFKKENKIRESIFEHLTQFKDFVDAIKPLLELEGINEEKNYSVDRIKDFMVSIISAVANSTFTTLSDTTNIKGAAAIIVGGVNVNREKKIRDSIFEHISQFKMFTEALKPLLEIEGIGDKDNKTVERIQDFMTNVIRIMKESIFETSSSTVNGDGIATILGGGFNFSAEKKTRDTIFEHISQFKDFVDAIKPLLEIEFAEGVDASDTFRNVSEFMQAVIVALSNSIFTKENNYLNANGGGGGILGIGGLGFNVTAEKKVRESIFEHLKDFKSFAESLLPFLNIKFDKDTDPEKVFTNVSNFMIAVIGAVMGSTFENSSEIIKTGGKGSGVLIGGGLEFNFSNEKKTQDSIFNHLQHFKDFASSLEPLLKIPGIGDEKNDTAARITNFMETVIEVLNASVFRTSDSDKRSGGYAEANLFGASGSYNQSDVQHTYDSIFNHISGFKDFATSLEPMLKITGIGKEDDKTVERITSFMKTIIKVLLQSNFTTSSAWSESESARSWAEFSSKSKSEQKTYDSIFNHIAHFKDFADSLKPMLEIKDLGKEKVDSLKSFIKELIEVLNLSVFDLESSESKDKSSGNYEANILSSKGNLESSAQESKVVRDSIFNHLKDFKSFTEGLQTLLGIQKLPAENIENLKKFVIDLATTLITTTQMPVSIENSESANVAGIISASEESKYTYDSIFNHLQYFNTFAEGVKTLLELTPQMSEETVGKLTYFLTEVFKALRWTTMTAEEHTVQETKVLFASENKTTDRTLTNIFDHMEHFKEFAEGMSTIMTAVSNEKFDQEKFVTTISTMFGALRSLALEEERTKKESKGWFGSGESSESSTTFNMDILNHITDLQNLATALQSFINMGIGVDEGLGERFKTSFTAIAESFQKLAPLSEVAWENIDIETMKGFADALTLYKTMLADWNVEAIQTQTTEIANFITTILTLFNDTERIAQVTENAKTLGNSISTSIIEGLRNQSEIFITAFKDYIVQNTQTGFMNGKVDIENITRSNFVEVIAQYIASQNAELLQQAARDGIIRVMLNAIEGEKTNVQNSLYEGVIKPISEKITNSEQSFIDNGKYITQGLAKGMSEEVWRINDAIGKISDAAIITLKQLLGIASPSKIFYEMGSYMGQGLVNGLTDMASEVAEATESLVSTINAELNDIEVVNLNDKIATGISNKGSSSQTVKNITFNNNNNISNGLDMSAFLGQLRWDIARS